MQQSFLPYLRSPILLNLEAENDSTARIWAKKVGHLVGGIKPGRNLVLRYGAPLVHELAQIAPIMLDFKLFDSAENMEAAVRTLFEIGATIVTVHAGAGVDVLSRISMVEKELNVNRPFLVVAETFLNKSSQVLDLANIALRSGLTGLTCSSSEVSTLKSSHPTSFIIAAKTGNQLNPLAILKAGAAAFSISSSDFALNEATTQIQEILKTLTNLAIKPAPVPPRDSNPTDLFASLDFSNLLVPSRADRHPVHLDAAIYIKDTKKTVLGEIINISETGLAIKVKAGSYEQGWSLSADVEGTRLIRPFEFNGVIQRVGLSNQDIILGVSFSKQSNTEHKAVIDFIDNLKKNNLWNERT